jgi:hypothetical protein
MAFRLMFVTALAMVAFTVSSAAAAGVYGRAIAGPCGGIGDCWEPGGPDNCNECSGGGNPCLEGACCDSYLVDSDFCFDCTYHYAMEYDVYFADIGCHEPCYSYTAWICYGYMPIVHTPLSDH